MRHRRALLVSSIFVLTAIATVASAAQWTQWRGPSRDGQAVTETWPDNLDGLEQVWQAELGGPAYSSPLVTDHHVYTIETRAEKDEVARAFDRATGEQLWETSWEGAMTVPRFARANGSWIKATPATDGQVVAFAGMLENVVAVDAKTGDQLWSVDFPKTFDTDVPMFGCSSSPLIDGDAVYMQAGWSVARLDRTTGQVVWRGFEGANENASTAYASPVMAEVLGKKMLIVQSRIALVGIDPDTGMSFGRSRSARGVAPRC